MSILRSTNSGIVQITKANIEKWLKDHNISKFKFNSLSEKEPYFSIDIIESDVNLMGLDDSELPDYIVFNEIREGNFICSYSKLTSMRGFPKKVGKNFDISFSRITSLEDAPTEVNNFVACGLPFTEQQIREKIQEMKKQIKGKVFC